MSKMKEKFVFGCRWLISCVAGGFAYGGVAGILWLHNGRQLEAVVVGLAVMMLVMRGLCGFIEDWEKHKQKRAEERERFRKSARQQEEEDESAGWEWEQ